MKRALFVRMDRIGDLVLTLPCDNLVSGDYEVHWAIPAGLDWVIESALPSKKFASFSPRFSWRTFFKFVSYVRRLKPEVSLSFHVPWWINGALWLARVPRRGGVLSQWHSYLFLNRGQRQKRSHSEFHELEYNYMLVEATFKLSRNREKWHYQKLECDKHQQLPWDTDQDYVVVHPGMGGSALNWPTSNYQELISKITLHRPVIITGTGGDMEYLAPLKLALGDNPQVIWLDNQLSGPQLLKLLANSSALVAPSTGVLHLAASLGTNCYGIFSPIKVHHARRWGAKGQYVHNFLPNNSCPSQFVCLGKECQYFNCMAAISPATVLKALELQK